MKSRLANTQAKAMAQRVFENFNQYATLFTSTDANMQTMFKTQNWEGMAQSKMMQVNTYKHHVQQIANTLRQEFSAHVLSDQIWQQTKTEYANLLHEHPQSEWAKAYFSSISTEILQCHYFDNPFVFSKFDLLNKQFALPAHTFSLPYTHSSDLKQIWNEILTYFDWQTPFHDLENTLDNIIQTMKTHCQTSTEPSTQPWHVDVLKSAFYHQQYAYVFGRIHQNTHSQTFALIIGHHANGLLCVRAIFSEHEPIAALFSSMQTYFLADLDLPSTYVEFLHAMSPNQSKEGWYAFLEPKP